MEMNYTETKDFPMELYRELDEELKIALSGYELKFVVARDDEVRGAAVFSLLPEGGRAVLHCLAIKSGDEKERVELGIGLIENSFILLDQRKVTRVTILADDRLWEKEMVLRLYERFGERFPIRRREYLRYGYSAVRDSDICRNMAELPSFGKDLLDLMEEGSPEAQKALKGFEKLGVDLDVYPLKTFFGRYAMPEEGYAGAVVGGEDNAGNYRILSYYGHSRDGSEWLYKRFVLGMIAGYLESAASDTHIDIACENEAQRGFLLRNFGVPKLLGRVTDFNIRLEQYDEVFSYRLLYEVDEAVLDFIPYNYRESWKSGHSAVAAATTEQGEVAAAIVFSLPDSGGMCGRIVFIKVDESFRRRGVGRTLLEKALDRNALWDRGTVRCMCPPETKGFFEACGFTERDVFNRNISYRLKDFLDSRFYVQMDSRRELYSRIREGREVSEEELLVFRDRVEKEQGVLVPEHLDEELAVYYYEKGVLQAIFDYRRSGDKEITRNGIYALYDQIDRKAATAIALCGMAKAASRVMPPDTLVNLEVFSVGESNGILQMLQDDAIYKIRVAMEREV